MKKRKKKVLEVSDEQPKSSRSAKISSLPSTFRKRKKKKLKKDCASHLKKHQWKPGQSGNPGGRKKGTISLTRILREKLQEIVDKKKGTTKADKFVEKFLKQAMKADKFKYSKEILDRMEGKPLERVKTVTDEGELGSVSDEILQEMMNDAK